MEAYLYSWCISCGAACGSTPALGSNLINIKTGGVNRGNIFGITKDNQLNAGRLVFVFVRLSQIPCCSCTCDQLVSLQLVKLASAFLLWRSALTACTLSSCGGRRRNVSHPYQPKGSVACVSIRAYLSSNETLCDCGGGVFGVRASSVGLLHLVTRLQACGGTQYLTDW